ncbi:MAG TPA: hypothetical protein VE999_07585 [Gemmataceae bacterium]|nr:hypothetical protein [Gemmataceae bacterium]
MSDRLQIAESQSVPRAVPSRSAPPRRILLPILLACGAFLLLHGRSLIGPVLFYDDFQILSQSRTWQRTCEGLWVPQNEHAMPLGRLLCFGLEWLAGRLPVLPFLTCLVGPVALLLGLWLLYIFVRRELGHPFYAVLAIVLFAVTSVYHQAVWWFAASFAILSLDMMLLGLLAVQRWRQTGRGLYLDLAVLACLLAPGWFALGILAGPLCCLYLLPFPSPPTPLPTGERGEKIPTHLPTEERREILPPSPRWGEGLGVRGQIPRHWTLLPLAGTALFLAVSLPRTAEAILHTGHYGEKTAVEAFNPRIGLQYSARALVDNLLLGLAGVTGVALPWWCIAVILPGVVAVCVWWWRQARDRRLMLLGLGMIGSSYLLCYSARALWDYEMMVEPRFSRYHLLPHMGLVLFFCGGLPARAGHWFTLDPAGTITARQRRFVYWLIGVCFLVNLPRGLLLSSPTDWRQFVQVREQQTVLRRIEEIEARCRQHHISAAAARQALGRLDIPLSLDVIDGSDFLIGSDDPRPLPREEVKRLLEAP